MTCDFEVDIAAVDGSPGEYRVEVVDSPAGVATARMRLDPGLLLARRPELQSTVLASAVRARAEPHVVERPIREVGRDLFAALFTTPIYGRYAGSTATAAERGERLQVVLRLRPPELAALPWEAMFDPENGYLCQADPLLRFVHAAVPGPPLRVMPPLRILGLISAPDDLPTLDVDDEQRRLTEALAGLGGRVELVWASGGRWRDLQNALVRGAWHVVHFVGHGGFRDGEGVLALVGRNGQAEYVSASRFATLLSAATPSPRLVVLNSCSSAEAAADDVFSSTAAWMVRQVPAVVAMQFAVSDPAALAFADGFYRAIAENRTIGEAVRQGRIAIVGTGERTLEWVTPVLYLRNSDAPLFAVTEPTTGAEARPPEGQTPEQAGQDAALNGLYVQALAELRQGDDRTAVTLLDSLIAQSPDYRDAAERRDAARRRLRAAAAYQRGVAAERRQDWVAAVREYSAAAPDHPDAEARRDVCLTRQRIADLQAEMRLHADAGGWAAVLAVAAEIATLDPAAADPAGIATEARRHVRGGPDSDAGDDPQQLEQLRPASPPAPAGVLDDPRWTGALETFYANQWTEAVARLEALQTEYPDDPRVHDRLLAARRAGDLARWWADAEAAAGRDDWVRAVAALERVTAVDPDYRNASSRLEKARAGRMRQTLIQEITALHHAGRWQAVHAAGAELHRIDPDRPDPDGMIADARQRLADETIADRYGQAVRLLDAGDRASAATLFAEIDRERPGHRDVIALLALASGAPPTRIVARTGTYRHHTTIAAAVDAASDGDRILIKPGDYPESLSIAKEIELVGDGTAAEITVRSPGGPVLSLNGPAARVRNLTLWHEGGTDQPVPGTFAAVHVTGGTPTVEDCDIRSDAACGVLVSGETDPTFRGNRIHDNQQAGVVVVNQGRGSFESNDIFANAMSGVEVGSGGYPIVCANRMHDNHTGAFLHDDGRGLFEGNDVFGNAISGIEVKSGGDPLVRGNNIHDNKQPGVLVHEQGRGTFEGNDVAANGLSGVEVRSGSDPVLRMNQIHGNQSGAMVHDQGRALFENNDIFANSISGIQVKSGGDPVVRANKLHENKASGALVLEDGRGTFENNDIFANDFAGVSVKSAGNPVVRGNRIHDNKQPGVYVVEQGRGTFESNDIFANALSGIEVRSGGDPAVRMNQLHENRTGAMVHDKGRGTFEDNDIFANTVHGVHLKSDPGPVLRGNKIHENQGHGVFVTWDARATLTNNEIYSNKSTNLKIAFLAVVNQSGNHIR